MNRKLPKICIALTIFTTGLFLLAKALVFCGEPTSATMEKINKMNRQRLAEQPAISNKAALAQYSEQ